MVVTRFSPSPTGYLHIGGVRTALYNYLYAKKHNGKFILRIDDTDDNRNIEAAVTPIIDGLKWLGINWDEGPIYQSTRHDRYKEIATELLDKDKAYHDDGAIRLRITKDILVEDLIRGSISFTKNTLKDPVIVRRDGKCLYNFATVVDDHDMGITHILRGEEHLSNTPFQSAIYDALGWTTPNFGHLSFICLPNSRKKLSKRDGKNFISKDMADRIKSLDYSEDFNPITLSYYKYLGYLPDGVVNYLALLGWSLDDHSEFFTLKDLISCFSLEGINKSPASFDSKKFYHINSLHSKVQLLDDKVEDCSRFIPSADKGLLKKVIEAAADRIKISSDILTYGLPFFKDPVYDLDLLKKYLLKDNIKDYLLSYLDSNNLAEDKLYAYFNSLGIKPATAIQALRVACTGQTVGIGLFDMINLMGLDVVRSRVTLAITLLEKTL